MDIINILFYNQQRIVSSIEPKGKEMGKRLSSTAWSTRIPAVVFVTPKGISLKRIPDETYDRLADEINKIIGRRDGGFTAVRRKGIWEADFAVPLNERDIRRLSITISSALASVR